jgi:2-phosphosulfolactate phosphatase
MEINVYKSVDDAKIANGLAIIIDVFRAFTTEAYMFDKGAKYVIPVLTLEQAYELKNLHPDYLLIGERGGVMPEGFDYGNSPTEILSVDFTDKVIVHTTSNGTVGLMNAVHADEIIVGSFVMSEAIIKYINDTNPEIVSLVPTAPISEGSDSKNEDILFAEYIKSRLEGVPYNKDDLEQVLKDTSAYKYLFNEIGVPESDFELCLDLGRFDFVIKKTVKDDVLILEKLAV